MESDLNQDKGKVRKEKILYKEFPFLYYIKGRLVSYIHPETKKVYVGHVAMYYCDTGKIRIDWDNGAITYHDFKKDSKWIFHKVNKK